MSASTFQNELDAPAALTIVGFVLRLFRNYLRFGNCLFLNVFRFLCFSVLHILICLDVRSGNFVWFHLAPRSARGAYQFCSQKGANDILRVLRQLCYLVSLVFPPAIEGGYSNLLVYSSFFCAHN